MNVNAASELKDDGNEEKLNCWRWCLLHCALTPAGSHLKPHRAGRDVLGGTRGMVPAPQASPCCSHDSAACLEASCHHACLCPCEGRVTVSSDRPGCDPIPVPPSWQQQTPWGFPKALPPTLLHVGLRALTAFFPPSLSPQGKKKPWIWNNLLAPSSSSHPTSPEAITETGF